MIWTLVPTPNFKSRYKRKRKELRDKVDEALHLLITEPQPHLFCRPKYGHLDGLYGYDLDDNNRILMKIDEEKMEIKLLRVCSHKRVYGSR